MSLASIMISRAHSEADINQLLKSTRKRKLLTLRSLTADQQQTIHYDDVWGCLTRNFGKGFVLGVLAKIGLNGLWLLVSILRGRKVTSGKTSVADLFPGSTKFGIFVGALLSIFNCTAYLTKETDSQSMIGRYRGAIAGALAGASLMFAPKSMRWTIMLSMFVRAIEIQLKMLVERGSLPSWLHPNSYGDLLIMGAASAWNMTCLFMNQGCFSPSYRKFLNQFSQLTPEQLQSLDLMARGVALDIPGMCH